jgi:cell division protein FtsQ
MLSGLALTLVVIGYVLYVAVVSPWLRISRVVVQADFDIERSTLLESIGLDGPASFFSVRPSEIVAQLEAHPMIRSAAVERVFPDTVRLDLTRRRPLALALTVRNGRSIPIVLDESGTIFDTGAHLAERDIPVISGISFEGNVVGSRLPAGLVPLLEDLQQIRISSPEIYGLISEIRVEPRVAGGFDLLLFTKGFPVPVRTDGTLDQATCTYALMVLDVLAQRGEADGVAEIDFRSGEIVYRMKEAESGR